MLPFVQFMQEISGSERCAFHFTNASTAVCSHCKLPICDLDQKVSAKGERICNICYNIERVGGLVKTIQGGLFFLIFGSLIVLLITSGWTYIWIPLVLFFVFPLALRTFVLYSYFKGITNKEAILPLLRYFEAYGNVEYYKLFIKKFRTLEPEDKKQIKEVLFPYLVPAIAFGYSNLPDKWEEELLNVLEMKQEEFYKIIAEQGERLVKVAVYNAHPDISQFIFKVAEITNDKELIKKYIREICNPTILELDDKELNTIYSKTLEELFLYEEQFLQYCDELNMEKEKECIKQLLSRYEPPPVPKNQLEAVLTLEQLKEKRRQEEQNNLE